MEKCSEYEMFLIELGKFWHKFRVNRVNRTQVMAKLVDLTQFWTVCKDAIISCGIRMKLEFWPE